MRVLQKDCINCRNLDFGAKNESKRSMQDNIIWDYQVVLGLWSSIYTYFLDERRNLGSLETNFLHQMNSWQGCYSMFEMSHIRNDLTLKLGRSCHFGTHGKLFFFFSYKKINLHPQRPKGIIW